MCVILLNASLIKLSSNKAYNISPRLTFYTNCKAYVK